MRKTGEWIQPIMVLYAKEESSLSEIFLDFYLNPS